jgi:hypothetical protein
MTKLTAQEAFMLAKSFRDLSVSLGDYRFENWNRLTEKQRKTIEDAELCLLNASAEIRTVAVGLVMDETQLSFEKLQQTTSDAKNAVGLLEKVSKVLKVAGAAVSLAGAVVSLDFGAVVKTAKGLYDAITGKKSAV